MSINTITPINWFEDFNGANFGFIRQAACNNNLPFDDKLKTISLPRCIEAVDGFGIQGSFENHQIVFTVVVVNYEECGGDPDDPNWEYQLIPTLWLYSGTWDKHKIEGLASSSQLAVGKMLQGIYRNANVHNPEVASALKTHKFKFRTFGFC